MARDLSDLGHKVTVLTINEPPGSLSRWDADLDGISVIHTTIADVPKDYGLLKRLLFIAYRRTDGVPIIGKLIRNICFFILPMDFHLLFDLNSDPRIEALDPDVMIATGGPWNIFESARILQERKKIPLYLDYRDSWSIYDPKLEFGELHDLGSGLLGALKRWTNKVRERRIGSRATGITAVSDKMLNNCSIASGVTNKRVIMNGYGDGPKGETASDPNKLTLTFSGIINRNQVFDLLIRGIEIFKKEHEEIFFKIQFNLIGVLSSNPRNLKALYSSSIKDQVNATEYVDLDRSLQIQKASDVLICLGLRGTEGVPGSKIYEYLNAQKPILLISESDDGRESIVTRTNSGMICRDPKEFSDAIKKLYDQWRSPYGIAHDPNQEVIEQYSYRSQFQLLSEFLLEGSYTDK